MIPAKLVDRYLARLIAVPLAATMVIAAMLLLLEKMLRLFDFVAQQGGPVSVVWRMLANLIPEYLSLGIPIGLMLGVLLAFRRLAVSSELDVLMATGYSYRRLLRVPYMFAGALAFVNLMIVGFLQPYSRYAYEGLRYELRTGALGSSIKVGEFTTLGKGMTLRVERSQDGGRELSGIFVMAERDGAKKLAVTAEHGRFMATDDVNTIILRLRNGSLVHDQPGFSSPRVLTFANHDLPIDLPKEGAFRLRGGRDGELTIPELVRTGHAGNGDKKEERKSRAEFHFRLTEVATMMLLPLLGVALAVPPKRSSSAVGVFLSIVMIVSYYKINEYAEALGARGGMSPFFALWIPFALFAGLIWWMYSTLAHVPGGQPIAALERQASRFGAWLRRRFARHDPAAIAAG
ncbi:LPS export ABC transporter permease LptF [Sphingomonas bacterium]|uniref:LPS export ABC transporter permease LptF n=1 Tax=Sphingomonas bacterium TaxID=1895847 RepID=UPI001575E2AC|nr:LPS export ABC transporter permease LptF [Sphingomonas bacterium]